MDEYPQKNKFIKEVCIFQMSWMLILFAKNVYYLYMARFLNGFFGGGSYTIVPLFLYEIAEDQ